MIYEKRIGSLPTLKKELRALDGDAGIRVIGRYGGKKCFAFVTRFGGDFTVQVYAAGSASSLGERLASKEFPSVEGVVSFLRPIATASVEAYAY